MAGLITKIGKYTQNPGYAAMRGVARFPIARDVVSGVVGALNSRGLSAYAADCETRMADTAFQDVDRDRFLRDLKRDGLAFGLMLPATTVAEIRRYADETDCYADRNPKLGFNHANREAAEAVLGKPILLAQYYNTIRDCGAIAALTRDPFLSWVAAKYLGAPPQLFGVNLWWTFPVKASEEDRNRHAHLYHRDVDDFRFFKFFFYITDVQDGEGAHVCVAASNHRPPVFKRADSWSIRRYADAEIETFYKPDAIKEICGAAGTGFAEDTLCIHKGSTPKSEPRLLLQLQYGLFDYGNMHDRADADRLQKIA